MSPVATPIGTCPTGKMRYDSYQRAARALKEKKRRKSGLSKPVKMYRCKVCSGWHLSSTKKR